MSRKIQHIFTGKPTLEGAGVHLHRVFGGMSHVKLTDPFLLFDDFSAKNPEDYVAGFPWHPHRGIETVTYILQGSVQHGDSMGNKGTIADGQVQWMTAGSGIIHEEMPQRSAQLQGFQLWVNLPQKHKMMSPRYQDVHADQIVGFQDGDAFVKIICGTVHGKHGPVQEVMAEPLYLDVRVPAGKSWELAVPEDYTVLVYVYEGAVYADQKLAAGQCGVFEFSKTLKLSVTDNSAFLVLAGKPLCEPVAWAGPIVMNTQEELALAFSEYEQGTFIKK